MIDHLIRKLRVDPTRVYVVGASSGAFMAQRLTCERSEDIAAATFVIGTIASNILPECSPRAPVSMLMINGTEDRITPWVGGDSHFGFLKLGKKTSVPKTVERWVRRDRCAPSPTVVWEPDDDSADGTRIRCEVYGPCEDWSEVVLYAVEGGGRTWPGGPQCLPERIIGKTSADFNAAEVIWRFVQQHAKRQSIFSEGSPDQVASSHSISHGGAKGHSTTD